MHIPSVAQVAVFIRSRRKELKLSQREVGDLVGLKQKTISCIESAPENIRLSTLFRVLTALEIEFTLSPKDQPPMCTEWKEEW
jgi:HTH-type transcriptional regulator/antitoxin HipB